VWRYVFQRKVIVLFINNLGICSFIRFAVAEKLAKAVNKPSIKGTILLK